VIRPLPPAKPETPTEAPEEADVSDERRNSTERRKASLNPADFIKPVNMVDDKKIIEAIREAKQTARSNGNGNGVQPHRTDVDYVVAARNAKGVGVEIRMIVPPEIVQAMDDVLWERAPNGSRKYPWRTRQDVGRWFFADGLVKLASNSDVPAKSMISMMAMQKALRNRFLLLENGDEELKHVEELAHRVEGKNRSPVKYLRGLLADAEANLPEDEISLDLAKAYIEKLRQLIRRYES